MTKPGYTGLVRIAKAARYSIRGFRSAWRYESAFRQECTIAVILVPCAFLLAETFTQAGVLIAAIGLVLVAELLNSAIEAVWTGSVTNTTNSPVKPRTWALRRCW